MMNLKNNSKSQNAQQNAGQSVVRFFDQPAVRLGLKVLLVLVVLAINFPCLMMLMGFYGPLAFTLSPRMVQIFQEESKLSEMLILLVVGLTAFISIPISMLGGFVPAVDREECLYEQLMARRSRRRAFWAVGCVTLTACIIVSDILNRLGTISYWITDFDWFVLWLAYYIIVLFFGWNAVPTWNIKTLIEVDPPTWCTPLDLAEWASKPNDSHVMWTRFSKFVSELLPSNENDSAIWRGEATTALIEYIERICQEPLIKQEFRQDAGDSLIRCFSHPRADNFAWFDEDMPSEQLKLCQEYVNADDIRRGEIVRQLDTGRLESLVRYTAERKRYDQYQEFMEHLAATTRKIFRNHDISLE